jgi:hypothetical protein
MLWWRGVLANDVWGWAFIKIDLYPCFGGPFEIGMRIYDGKNIIYDSTFHVNLYNVLLCV